ncbi:MAG: hypothetical protein PW792_00495 [Acidobacteriaceae bacterium]|nr:hypothetical protein [Acidobacteriaceae bacterium]
MRRYAWMFVTVGMFASVCVQAQTFQSAPATDSSAQASPLPTKKALPAATDSSALASPAHGSVAGMKSGARVAPGTAVAVTLERAIDSGRLKNGDTVHAKLKAPMKTSLGVFQPGTPVEISVIATAPAGKLIATGEFSLEAVSVGGVDISTNVLTYRGRPGKRDLPDATPALGTDAGLAAGATLLFHVSNAAVAATMAPQNTEGAPGSVDGTAAGSAPPTQHNAK